MPSNAQEALESLAICLCASLEAADGPALCFCGLLPGEVAAADYIGDCEDGGMAWVRLAQGYPSRVLGAQNTDEGNCSLMWGMDVEMGVLRPISSGNDDGSAPSPVEMYAASLQQLSDVMAMRDAVNCCGFGRDAILGLYLPLGPQGGVVGGVFTVALQVP